MSNESLFHNSNSFVYFPNYINDISRAKNLCAIKKLHAHLFTTGLLVASIKFQTKLILSYTKCLPHNEFRTLTNFFKCMKPNNPIPFNVIISDLCRNGFHFLSLKTFSFMHNNDVSIDTYALCTALTASSSIKDVDFGKKAHAHVAKSGWISSVFVGSALVDLYAKSRLIRDAQVVFDEIPVKNTICANALLSGYGEANMWYKVLELIRLMPKLHLDYDHFTLSSILRACAGISATELGRQVHGYLFRSVFDLQSDVFLQSSLIEMYGKCGLVAKAWHVFTLAGIEIKESRKRDVILWTSMLGVYGRNGHYMEVIGLFKEMLKEETAPDNVAFVTVISACAYTGQVNLGIQYFDSMSCDFKLEPGPEHCSCLVDLLCKAGELDKAWSLVDEMLRRGKENCSVSIWGALLNACMDCGNIELGKKAACKALELDPQNVGIYVLLSNLYAKLNMWDEIEKLRELMNERGLKKDVGGSWIEIIS